MSVCFTSSPPTPVFVITCSACAKSTSAALQAILSSRSDNHRGRETALCAVGQARGSEPKFILIAVKTNGVDSGHVTHGCPEEEVRFLPAFAARYQCSLTHGENHCTKSLNKGMLLCGTVWSQLSFKLTGVVNITNELKNKYIKTLFPLCRNYLT